MTEPQQRELKSRYLELYPMHKCPQCHMEHTSIPHLTITMVKDGQPVESPLIPFELVGTAEVIMTPGQNAGSPYIPARILGLFWGPPGASEPAIKQLLFMN